MTKLNGCKVSFAFLVCFAAAIGSPAQTLTTLFSFNGTDGQNRYMSLIQGLNGNLYGTTYIGGTNNDGTIFTVTPEGRLTTLYSFCGEPNCSDGRLPDGALVQATDGNFYGTTTEAGANNGGTIFKITPGGTLTTIYSFCSQTNCADGQYPAAGLIQASDGSFYGTTAEGGATNFCSGGCGTIFKITPGGTLTTLYMFCSQFDCTDGVDPMAGLVQATSGVLYGTTYVGGDNDGGTVFKITLGGAFTTLYKFCSQNDCTDGRGPWAGLTQGTNGRLYGTTPYGGASNACSEGCGTVFEITAQGALTTLHSFDMADGEQPFAGLTLATDGNFYGTTEFGGGHNGRGCIVGCGTGFEITPDGTLTTLYSFCGQGGKGCTDGSVPYGGLIQATDGNFYGTTDEGGAFEDGTVFSLSTGLGPFATFVGAPAGRVGQSARILGQGFTGATSVSFNGIPASFAVRRDTFLVAMVPTGATTGYVTVTTPSGTLTSNVPFHVLP